jgi:HD-GYP domain-containing protein (c-di-GMP phosphodiesterase class II)
VDFLEAALPAIRSHHERWDGTGYPDGLSGEAIPLVARIVNIADTWDACTSRRPYQDPISSDVVIAILAVHEALLRALRRRSGRAA